jgi:O-acetyl-ADP-ribose deacetylase (regulator of RNase III)
MTSYSNIPIISEPNMFFQPLVVQGLTPKLYLAEGDMFFSKAQTVTVSVNTVGVMGKGLASRTRYQFSDVYVHYEDLCRSKKLKMGRPQLYKRESSLDYELADEPGTLPNGNLEKWFLLFPTKRHWREQADIAGIEEGLKWLSDNYKREGIKSLAVPALGCGLGRLEWRDVGPLMCRYFKNFDITVVIYLPAEKKVTTEFLSKDFLVG